MHVTRKRLHVLLLLFTIGFSVYLESPQSFLNKAYMVSKSEPVMGNMDSLPIPTQVPVLEDRLDKRETIGKFIFETYREYEITKDAKGKIVKMVPTSKTEILKYRDYSKK